MSDSIEPPDMRRPYVAPGAPVSRRFILVIRVVLLLVAAGAVTVGVVVGLSPARTSTTRYICPMHPDVVTATPGECPICRMALEPIRTDARGAAAVRESMAGDLDWRAVENVRKHDVVDVVRTRSLLYDVRELRGPAWVEDDGSIAAIFYKDQVAALAADEAGTFSPTAAPKETFSVRRSTDAGTPWDASTSRVRFELVRAAGVKPPSTGAAGWIELARKQRQVLTVPSSAVLQSSSGPYVLELADGNHLKKQAIEIGESFAGFGAVILSGLRPADRVVSRAAFFLDAERRQNAEPEGSTR